MVTLPKRISRITKLIYLQETDQSITQIAGELGYSNISKFARAFQAVFGLLPKDYRKAKKTN